MTDIEAGSSAVVLDATALLEHIDQVAHWVPRHDPGRQALLTEVSEMKHRLTGEPLSRGEVLNFQLNVWRLKAHRFKTLLVRRAAQFGELYGFSST